MTLYISNKVWREFLRVWLRLQALLMAPYERWLRYTNDRSRPDNFKIANGEISYISKVAIFLIYQPKNVSNSVFWTIDHLVQKGYSPLIISNLPLADEDLKKLKSISWRVIVRSNFGYDFGGYRDGIWLLDYWSIIPDNLIILNDSVWFPLYNNDSTIESMESSVEDFVGVIEYEKHSARQQINGSKKHKFFGSYFWMLKRGALANKEFSSFWKNYKPTSSKYNTVRNGEMLFSKIMMNAGVSFRALLRMEYIVAWLCQRSNIQLVDAIDDINSPDARLKTAIKEVRNSYEDSSLWRTRAFNIIFQITSKKNIRATAPTLSVYALNNGFFRKGSDAKGLESLRHFVKTVNEGKKLRKPHPSIWAEMEERCLGKN